MSYEQHINSMLAAYDRLGIDGLEPYLKPDPPSAKWVKTENGWIVCDTSKTLQKRIDERNAKLREGVVSE